MTDAELALIDAIVAQLRDGAPLHELAAGVDPSLVQVAVTIAGELAETGAFAGAALPAGFTAVWEGVGALGGVGASGGAAGGAAAAGGAGGGAAGGGAASGGAAGGAAAGGAGAGAAAGATGVAGAGGIASTGGVLGALGGLLGSATGVVAAVTGAVLVAGAIVTAVVVTGGSDDATDDVVAAEPDVGETDTSDGADGGGPSDDAGAGGGVAEDDGAAEDDVSAAEAPAGDEPPTTGDGLAGDPGLPLLAPAPDAGSDQPAQPQDPTDPAGPIDPTDPTDPGVPTDPVGPTEPTDPGAPTDPGGPTTPGQPGEPTDPGAPTDPGTPTDPGPPGTPIDPGGPAQPPPPPPPPATAPPAATDLELVLAYRRVPQPDGALAFGTAVVAIEDLADVDGAAAPPVDASSLEILQGATGGTVTVAVGAGELRYTHAEDHLGDDVVAFRICDTAGRCDDGTLTVTTTTMASAPVAGDVDAGRIEVGDSTRIQLLTGRDAPRVDAPPVVTVEVVEQPVGGSLGAIAVDDTVVFTAGAPGPASFTYRVCDAAGRCGEPATVTIEVALTPPAPPLGGPVRINFQPASLVPPAGYLVDHGRPFGSRTDTAGADALTYGWRDQVTRTPLDLSVGGTTPGNSRFRGVTGVPLLLNTLLHMQSADLPGFTDGVSARGLWELAVPDGLYDVTVGVGDPTFTDSSHTINVEGVELIRGFTPSGPAGAASRHAAAMTRVEVVDGALTIDAIGGRNTKIQYIEVVPVVVVDGIELRLPPSNQANLNLPGDVDHGTVQLSSPHADRLVRLGQSSTYRYEVLGAVPPRPYDITVEFRRTDGTPVIWAVSIVE